MELAVALAPLVLLAAFLVWLRSAGTKGALGEWRLRRRLRQLDADRYTSLHDLTLPSGDGTTQIDHVVICAQGVFVIETKNMAGWIFGHEDQAQWTQVLGRRRSSFQNPLRQNYKHCRTLQSVLDLREDQVISLVAFVGRARPKTAMPASVFWSTQAVVRRVARASAPVLAESDLPALIDRLRAAQIRPGRKTRRAHRRHLAQRAKARAEGPACPRCGAAMVTRTRRASDDRFLGCSRYPACHGTKALS